MWLIIVILILILWGVLDLKDKFTPSDPPIKNMEEHLRMVMQADPKDRKRVIKNAANQRKK